MNINETLAERLKALRDETGYSQKVVAEDLHISRAALGYYENGERVPGAAILLKLSNYYGVSVNYLLGKTKATVEENEPLCSYLGLSDKTISKIVSISRKNKYADAFFLECCEFWEKIQANKTKGECI